MRISHLKECLRLSQTLSFTQTAREFFISQPVLSKHIASLEESLGITVFARNKHGIVTTKEGELFLRDAANVVDRYDAAVRHAREIGEGSHETFVLGYLSGACARYLPGAIDRFGRLRPDVTLRLVSLEIDEIEDALNAGRIDIAIASSLNNDFALSDRFGWIPFLDDEAVLVTPPDHLFAQRESVDVSELEGIDLACPSPLFMKREQIILSHVLDPLDGNVRPHRILHDLDSIPLALTSSGLAMIGFKHFRLRFGRLLSYIPLTGTRPIRPQIGLAWERRIESRSILDFATVVAEEAAPFAL